MAEPTVHSGEFIRALSERQRAECIAIEGKKAEFRKSASRRILQLRDERLINVRSLSGLSRRDEGVF